MNKPLLSGDHNSLHDAEEIKLRPNRLEDFVGQTQFCENLKVFILAALQRSESLDHVFLSGPPGLGKTTLASIIAKEMRTELISTSAPALEKTSELVAILSSLQDGTVFFIDEIHRLRPPVEELLYTAMEDRELDVVIGQGPGARTVKVPLPSFTLIGATTKTGLVSGPLYSRFGITARLNFYDFNEISKIIWRSSRIFNIPFDELAVHELAKCSRGTPRVANRLLRRMRDFAQILQDGSVNSEIVKEGLNRLEVDAFGLDKVDRDILLSIITKYDGGPVGSETLALSISESVDTLEDVYEPYLIQSGLLQRTPRGRIATSLAYEHLGKLKSGGYNVDQQIFF